MCPPVGLHEIVPAPAQFNGQLFFDTDYTGFVVTEIMAVATARSSVLSFLFFCGCKLRLIAFFMISPGETVVSPLDRL